MLSVKWTCKITTYNKSFPKTSIYIFFICFPSKKLEACCVSSLLVQHYVIRFFTASEPLFFPASTRVMSGWIHWLMTLLSPSWKIVLSMSQNNEWETEACFLACFSAEASHLNERSSSHMRFIKLLLVLVHRPWMAGLSAIMNGFGRFLVLFWTKYDASLVACPNSDEACWER